MGRIEPKLKDCANENCDKQFRQFNSLVKVCSTACAIEYAKKKNQANAIKEAEQNKRQYNIDSMSTDKFRAKYIQPIINHIARLIDKDQPCIANPERTTGKMNGGHRHSVGTNRTLALNLHNVHIQSFESNHHRGGDHLKYRLGLKRVYGVEYADYVDEKLMQCPSLHINKQDLISLKPNLEAIRKRLISLNMTYTPKQRIRLRNELNKEIALYPLEFSVFNND